MTKEEVVFRVKNDSFIIELDKLRANPDTMLGRMFTTCSEIAKTNNQGEYVMNNIAPSLFQRFLEFYEKGKIDPENISYQELVAAGDYLQVPLNVHTLKYLPECYVIERFAPLLGNMKSAILSVAAHGDFYCYMHLFKGDLDDDTLDNINETLYEGTREEYRAISLMYCCPKAIQLVTDETYNIFKDYSDILSKYLASRGLKSTITFEKYDEPEKYDFISIKLDWS